MAEAGPSVHAGRYVIAVGTGRYRALPDSAQLSGVDDDLGRITALFQRFGYRPALPGLGTYASAQDIRNRLRYWCRDQHFAEDDCVVLYFAGHGLVGDRHYLLCWDSDENDLAASALPTEDLVRVLTDAGLRNLLLILDTCYGGAGGTDAALVALRRAAGGWPGEQWGGLWCLASARSRDEADDGAFVAALPGAIEAVTARTGQRQQYLDPHDLVGAVNDAFGRDGVRQRAELVFARSTRVPRFLPNAGYRRRLPPEGTDLETQRRAAQKDLAEHFGPRSRGVDFESEEGSYFSGRTVALRRLVAWLTTPGGDGRGRVVTGDPGCGKSAVLSRVVALSNPVYRSEADLTDADPATLVPENIVDVGVHARHKRLEDLVARIAADLGMPADSAGELLRTISHRARAGQKTVIVVDALDEAGSGTATDTGGRGEPRRIARELLRPLAEIRGVHLLVGTRREVIRFLGTMVRIDLDNPGLIGKSDITRYAVKMLIAADQPDLKTPYRERPELAEIVGRAVAERAAGVFLVARMTASSLRSQSEPVDTSRPGWADRLPSAIGDAFDDYLFRFGKDEVKVRQLLTPLAFAEGQGLPEELWPQFATAIAGRPYTRGHIEWLLDVAKAYIAEVQEPRQGRSVYRLYHQTLAEHLRDSCRWPAAEVQSRIVAALLGLVPGRSSGSLNWFDTHPYLRAHLATHAAAGDQIDRLLRDPGFLLAADQPALLSATDAAMSAEARQARAAYEQAAHRITGGDLGRRAAHLQLSARCCGANDLADAIEGLALVLPWRASWADWSRAGVHRRLLGHEGAVAAIAFHLLDGRPVAVSGDDRGTVRIWDLITLREIGTPLVGDPDGRDGITAIAVAEVDDYAVALLGRTDGAVIACDLSTGQLYRTPLRGHTNAVTALAVHRLGGRQVALSGSEDGSARVWDLRDWIEWGEPLIGDHLSVGAVALGELPSGPVAVTCEGTRVWLWDLEDRSPIGDPMLGHTGLIDAVALGRLDGRVVALTGDSGGTIRFWDLETRRQVGEPLWADRYWVTAVAVGSVEGETVAVTGGSEDLVRFWNLSSRQQVGPSLTGHTGPVKAVSLGQVNGRPVAVTGGADRTVRVWDLGADRPSDDVYQSFIALGIDHTGRLPYLVTGSADGTARLWDLGTGAQVDRPLAGHIGEVTAVALGVGPTGGVAFTGDEHGTVRVWSLPTAAPPMELTGHSNRVTALCHTTLDERLLLLSGSADGTVRVWELTDGAPVGHQLTGHNAAIDWLTTGVVDGEPAIVAASDSGWVSAWRLLDRRPLQLRTGWIRHDRTVAVACLGGRVVVLRQRRDKALIGWDVFEDRPATEPMVGHTATVVTAAIGSLAGAPMAVTADTDGMIRRWRLPDGAPLGAPFRNPRSYADQVALGSLRGVPVIVARDGGSVMRWNADSTEQLGESLIGYDPGVSVLAVVERERHPLLAVAGNDGVIRLRDPAAGLAVTDRLVGDQWARNLCAGSGPGGRWLLLSGGNDRTVRVWDLASKAEVGQYFEPSPRSRISITVLTVAERAGRLVAISGSDATALARVWDVETGAVVGELNGHAASVGAIDTAAWEGEVLVATGADDSTARLWRLDDLSPVGGPLGGHDGNVTAVSLIGLCGALALVTGDGEGALRCWRVPDGRQLRVPFSRHPLQVTRLASGPLDGREVLCVGSMDGLVRVWCLRDEELIAEVNLETYINDLAVAPGGLLYAGTDSGLVVIVLPS